MIGSLRGILLAKKPPLLIVEVAGVGYEVLASMNTFYQLPELGEVVFLVTHLVVREDAQVLYGFYDDQERTIFRELIKITGVGGKMALAILSGININDLLTCIKTRNSMPLLKIPGVGKKTAERLLIEMQDKMGKQIENKFFKIIAVSASDKIRKDAIEALLALGYKAQEANKVIQDITISADNSETLIKIALQELGK